MSRIRHFYNYNDASAFADEFNAGRVDFPFVATWDKADLFDTSILYSHNMDPSTSKVDVDKLVVGRIILGVSKMHNNRETDSSFVE